jgi:hypothetical protein
VILSGSQDQDLTIEKDRGGELTVARVSGRRRRGAALEVDDGAILMNSDGEEDVDDVRRRTANPEMVSRCPIASSRRERRRLETR